MQHAPHLFAGESTELIFNIDLMQLIFNIEPMQLIFNIPQKVYDSIFYWFIIFFGGHMMFVWGNGDL